MSKPLSRPEHREIFVLLAIFLFTLCAATPLASAQNLVATNNDARSSIDSKHTKDIDRRKVPAGAQPVSNDDKNTADEAKKKDSEASAEMNDRVRSLEEKLEEMQRTIAVQQQTIKSLSDRLGGDGSLSNTATATTATTGAAASANPTDLAAGQPQKAGALDDRVKSLEGQVLKIGGVRLSGDFRLRFDSILRAADNTPPAGFGALTHQQNSRARYRFRLNFDDDVNEKISFHGQLASGPINNTLTNDQDFGATNTRAPFFINEAWADYHPNKSVQLQGGRLLEVFADNSRFLFDDDIRFNGFNEKYTWFLKKPFASITSIEARAGQYIFSNPNVAIVTAGSPLAVAGAVVGSTGRDANLFHQGVLFNQKYNEKWSGQFGGDIQLFRNANQIQLASTANGVVLIVQGGLGLTLSGPIGGTGNATTTNGGAIYSARNFQIARFTYRATWAGFTEGDHVFPVTFNIQGSRNVVSGTPERDAVLASVQVGRITKPGDTSFLYIYTRKGANALISQLTDDDIGTNSGVNIQTHAFRFELGLMKKVTFQSLVFIQNELKNSGAFPNFFVPLNAFTPRQFRFQEQVVFSF